MLDVPVVLTIFNRPKTTARMLAAIRAARPKRLFVIADGPRPDHPADAELCARARALMDQVDWDCEVFRQESPANLGLDRRVITGFAWLFAQVDEAIILEDDCLPDSTFFRFCEEMLMRYEREERVVMIAGSNSLGRWRNVEQSYLFSYYGSQWGWATWKRAWKTFNESPADWTDPATRRRLQQVIADPGEFALFWRLVERTHRYGSWDCQWSLTHRLRGGLAAVPAVNLISNIGFGQRSSHTGYPLAFGANAIRYPMEFPLHHPPTVTPDRAFDRAYFEWQLGEPEAETIAAGVEQQFEAGRFVRGLLLVEAGLRSPGVRTPAERALLETLKARAVREVTVKSQ